MTLSYLTKFVQAPTTAPTVSSSSGAYLFAHRRVNLNGKHSIPSPNTAASALPITLTPQTYSDTTNLLRDEFIVSNDGGLTWRTIPRSGTLTGAQTITSYDGTWAITDRLDDQSVTPGTIDLGEYDVTGSDTQDIYVRNTGDPVGSLSASVINAATQLLYTEINGQVEIKLVAVYTESGSGVGSTANNRTIIWSTNSESSNTFPLTLPTNGVALFQVRLTNYPVGGLTGSGINFSLEFVANQRVNPIVFDRGWLQGTLLYSSQDGFGFPIVAYGGSSGVVTIAPFAYNYGGVSVVNARTQTFTAPNSNSKLIVYQTGAIDVIAQSTTTPTNATELLSFTVTTSVTNIVHKVNFRPVSIRKRTVTSGVLGDFIRINSSGNLVVSGASDVPHGVLLDSTGNYGVNGTYLVNAGGTITAGSKVTSNASGKAITTTAESPWVAITGGSSGDQILVESINTVATAITTVSSISDFNEGVDDRVNGLLVDSTSVTKSYNDASNTLTLSVPTEFVQDTVDAFIVNSASITKTYDDTGNTLTLNVTNEFVDDRVNDLLVVPSAGEFDMLTKTYNDVSNTLTLTVDGVKFGNAVVERASAQFSTLNTSIQYNYNSGLNLLNIDVVPTYKAFNQVGMVQMFAGTSAPTGWLLCQGQAVSRTTYSALFSVVGTTYGAGDGSTTFNLPDLRNRVPAGVGTDGALGSTSGATSKSVPLLEHTHTATTDTYNHTHTVAARETATAFGAIQAVAVPSNSGVVSTRATSSDAHSHVITVANAGTPGATLDVRQQTIYLNYIIYTGV